MLKEERLQKIVSYTNQHKFVAYTDLLKVLDCSLITIRRDVDYLDKEGLVLKVQSGLKAIDKIIDQDTNIGLRFNENIEAKKAIALQVIPYLKDGLIIYLDSGSTTNYLIEHLSKYDIKVYTNGIHHVSSLLSYNISTNIIGGHLKTNTNACIGKQAIDNLNDLVFDIAIMGTNAYDKDFGLSTPDEEEALVKSKAMEHANMVLVLVDQSKFNHRSYVRFGHNVKYHIISNNLK